MAVMKYMYRDGENYKVIAQAVFQPEEGENYRLHENVSALLGTATPDGELDLGFAPELQHPGKWAKDNLMGWEDFPTEMDGDLIVVGHSDVWVGDPEPLTHMRFDVPMTFSRFVSRYLNRVAAGQRDPNSLFMRRVRGEIE